MIIVDPNNYNKESMFVKSVQLVQNFFEHNSIPQPKAFSKTRLGDSYGCYEYNTRTIHCNVGKTKFPVKNPGFHWSYTGAKADLTIPGIIAHEAGHHIDACLAKDEKSPKAYIKKKACSKSLTVTSKFAEILLCEIYVRENSVSSYEPNVAEMLAESMRLFILNPELLREGRPMRYKYITDFLGLKPIVTAPWEKILENAHERLIAAQKSWIKNWVRKIDMNDSLSKSIAKALK